MGDVAEECLCAAPLEKITPPPSIDDSDNDSGSLLSWCPTSIGIITLGLCILSRFAIFEYQLAKRKSAEQKIRFTWSELLSYRLDYYLSSSQWAKPMLLLSATFLLIYTGALLLSIVENMPIDASAWIAWTWIADPGTHADAEGFMTRTVAFIISIGGMLVFAFMIGIISDFIGDKLEQLKKGESRVIETNHTLMLGWSDKSLAIIQQIAFANESEGGGTVVVLAEKNKEEMEAELQAAIDIEESGMKLMGTVVIFRSGNPRVVANLRKVSVSTARSIIALSTDGADPDEQDSDMVRQVLALKGIEDISCHVVVELQDIDNKSSIKLVAPELAEVVVAHDIVGRLMIQCAREPGLAEVLEALIGFEGDEFYTEKWPELYGKTFREITCRFDDAVPVGIKDKDGNIFINPNEDFVVEEGSAIMCLAEDNDTYSVNNGTYDIDNCGRTRRKSMIQQAPEMLLFCGWRRDLADMIVQLDEYVMEGSELWLFNMAPVQDRSELLKDQGNKEELHLRNITIKNVLGNHIIRRDLKLLQALDYDGKPTGETTTLTEFDSVLILADSITNASDVQSSDSRSLSSLLIVQDIQREMAEAEWERRGKKGKCRYPPFPVGEILDTRTRGLLRLADCQGFIMSNQIVSAAIAQIAEDRDMNIVLRELLSAEGSETHIREISSFVDLSYENQLSFWDISLRGLQRREIVLGYKPKDMSFQQAKNYLLNPPDKATPREWQRGDLIMVFAMD